MKKGVADKRLSLKSYVKNNRSFSQDGAVIFVTLNLFKILYFIFNFLKFLLPPTSPSVIIYKNQKIKNV